MEKPYKCKLSTQHIDDIKAAELTGEPVFHRTWRTIIFDLKEVEAYSHSIIKLDPETELPVCNIDFKSGNYILVNKTFKEFDEDYRKFMGIKIVNE